MAVVLVLLAMALLPGEELAARHADPRDEAIGGELVAQVRQWRLKIAAFCSVVQRRRGRLELDIDLLAAGERPTAS